jgi:predicted fused transcriptional regulator/phosphomethylpyrimidine kinase
MNIRYSQEILQACQAANLSTAPFTSWDESLAVESCGGSTFEWGLAEKIRGLGIVPDIIYELGVVGKEAKVWVLGHNAQEVARKTLMIRHRLSRQ